MAKAKRKAYRVTMRPDDGSVHPVAGRELVRIHEVFAESEGAAREYATEQALAERAGHGATLYVVASVERV